MLATAPATPIFVCARNTHWTGETGGAATEAQILQRNES